MRTRSLVPLIVVWVAALAAGLTCENVLGAPAPAVTSPPFGQRSELAALAARILRADYAGDRQALADLADRAAALGGSSELAAPAGYWAGFAFWRRALNGFNETPPAADLDADLAAAVTAFERAFSNPEFAADAKSAAAACLMSRAFLARQADPASDFKPWLERFSPLIQQAVAAAPRNPRVMWVWGAQVFYTPESMGGGQEKALALLRQGLADAGAERAAAEPCADTLLPRWGLAEMLMNLGYFEFHRSSPDLSAAIAYARAALAVEPSWHFLRDVLIPQIEGRMNTGPANAEAR